MEEETTSQIIERSSIDATTLIGYLKQLEVNEEVSYEKLSSLIGSDVQVRRSALDTARKSLLNEHQMVFSVIRGIGIKRLDDSTKVDVAGNVIPAVRRKLKRGVQILASVEYNSLPNTKKTEHNQLASYFGTILETTKTPFQTRLLHAVEREGCALAMEKTLEVFSK